MGLSAGDRVLAWTQALEPSATAFLGALGVLFVYSRGLLWQRAAKKTPGRRHPAGDADAAFVCVKRRSIRFVAK